MEYRQLDFISSAAIECGKILRMGSAKRRPAVKIPEGLYECVEEANPHVTRKQVLELAKAFERCAMLESSPRRREYADKYIAVIRSLVAEEHLDSDELRMKYYHLLSEISIAASIERNEERAVMNPAEGRKKQWQEQRAARRFARQEKAQPPQAPAPTSAEPVKDQEALPSYFVDHPALRKPTLGAAASAETPVPSAPEPMLDPDNLPSYFENHPALRNSKSSQAVSSPESMHSHIKNAESSKIGGTSR